MSQLSQAIKGLATDPPVEGDLPNRIEDCLRELRRAKAYLWHGSPHRALRTLDELSWNIGTESPRASELQEKLEEFMNYITSNVTSIPNYSDRHRHGEPIASGFVESARQSGGQQARSVQKFERSDRTMRKPAAR